MPMPSLKTVFGKELFTYVSVCIYVHIYIRALFKNMISELGIDIATWIFGSALNAS